MLTKSEILNAFMFRHACKEFDPDQLISEDDFKFILETGRLSPSSFGFEPWQFVVVQKKEDKEQLKKHAWGAPLKLDTASHFLLVLSFKSALIKWDSPYIKSFMENVQKHSEQVKEMRLKMFENFQKKDFDLTDERKIFDWASKQSYIAMANMMTSAALIGIDSCPIEGFHKEETEKILKNHFGIDTDKYGISYMLAFGYRKNNQPEKTRRNFDEVVRWI